MSGARGVAEVYSAQWSTHLNGEVAKALRQTLSEKPSDPVNRPGQLLTASSVGAPPPSSTPAGIVLDYNATWFDHVNATVTQAMKQTLVQRPDNPVVYLGRLLLVASANAATPSAARTALAPSPEFLGIHPAIKILMAKAASPLFASIDSDNNGHLSLSELESMLLNDPTNSCAPALPA